MIWVLISLKSQRFQRSELSGRSQKGRLPAGKAGTAHGQFI